VSLWQLKIPERKKNTLDIISYKKLYRNTNLRNLTFSLELDITGINIPPKEWPYHWNTHWLQLYMELYLPLWELLCWLELNMISL
jgi:hypothetical protein